MAQYINLSMKHAVEQHLLACNTITRQTLAWTATIKLKPWIHPKLWRNSNTHFFSINQSMDIKIYCTLKEANSNDVIIL